MVPRSQHRLLVGAVLALWLAVLIGGISATARWEGEPGDAGTAPATWPAGASVALAPGSWTLILFAHPRCPCTRSSLHELERIVVRTDAPGASTR